MKRLGLWWLAVDVVIVALLLVGRGRPEANAHPAIRHGGADWY